MSTPPNWKVTILATLIAGVVGFAFARYSTPEKIVVKTEEVVKEVIKEKRDVVIVKQMIERPDGTKETTERTEERTENTTRTDREARTETKVDNKKPDWMFAVTAGISADRDAERTYGLSVQRRILGPVFLGAYGDTGKNVGISVGLEF